MNAIMERRADNSAAGAYIKILGFLVAFVASFVIVYALTPDLATLFNIWLAVGLSWFYGLIIWFIWRTVFRPTS